MHAISSYRGNRPTDRTDYNTMQCTAASAQCNNPKYETIHNEYMQENRGINQQERQITFHGSAYPTLHSQYTHRSNALPEDSLGGLPSLSLTTEGSWMLWGRVAKPFTRKFQSKSLLLPVCNYSCNFSTKSGNTARKRWKVNNGATDAIIIWTCLYVML